MYVSSLVLPSGTLAAGILFLGVVSRSIGIGLHFTLELFVAFLLKPFIALVDLFLELLFGLFLDLSACLPNDLPGTFDGIIRDIPQLRFGIFGGRIVLIVVDTRFGLSPCIDLLCALAYITGLVNDLRSIVPWLLLRIGNCC